MRGGKQTGYEAQRFVALDLLRGIAALAIVSRHYPWPGGGPPFLPRDYLAVDLFFVLSGFVIAHAYGARLADGMRPSAFLLQRLVRLYPLYLLATLAGAAVWLAAMLAGAAGAPSPGQWGSALALNLAFAPAPGHAGWLTQVPYPFVGPAWSLLWELGANLMLAWLYPRIARRLPLVLGGGAAMLALAAATHGSLDIGPYWGDFSGGACRVVYCFFAGVALFRMRPRIAFRVPDWALGLALLALFLPPATMPLGAAYDAAVALLAMPLVVLLGAEAKGSRVTRQLGAWLGHCSYGVYVLHGPLLLAAGLASPALLGRGLMTFGYPGVALVMAASLALAHVATQAFDAPMRRLLRRALDRRYALAFTTTRPAAP